MSNAQIRYVIVAGATALVVFVGIVVATSRFSTYAQQAFEETPADVAAMTEFEKGQYYFNHDDDPKGPYDLEKARLHYSNVIAQEPRENILVWYQLGRIDFLEGKFDDAIYKFNKQVDYFGDRLPQVRYMLGLAYAYRARTSEDIEDWDAAEAEFNKFLIHTPDSPWGRTDLAWVYFAQGAYEAMLPVLEAGLDYTNNSPWLHNMYGLALLNLDRANEAYTHFEHAVVLAETLTEEDWGKAYPGNDPHSWREGLDSFREVIAYNKTLAEAALQTSP